ncbi:hypothetical protein RAM_24105 [Amycolatopsis mediterranei S699]|uniref:Uncharacterized protein n=1 Tax=Amycolatopsis mediterranei (strain S699) TaxID=713604 RepID=A0A9R0UA33_AMYMS|nr:hypothetical protein RAM_24105 [Amycolatopsis mediterranei S699]
MFNKESVACRSRIEALESGFDRLERLLDVAARREISATTFPGVQAC